MPSQDSLSKKNLSIEPVEEVAINSTWEHVLVARLFSLLPVSSL